MTILRVYPDVHLRMPLEPEGAPSGSGEPPVQPANVEQTPPPATQVMSAADVEALLNRVRSEEKQKLNARIAREKDERTKAQKERDELRVQRDQLEQERRENDIQRLKPDERAAAQIRQMQEQAQRDRETFAQQLAERDALQRATELVGYRERAIREYGTEIFASMVMGSSEEEIDKSAEEAHKTWKSEREKLSTKLRAEMEQELALRGVQPTQPQVPTAVIPQNPAFVQPQHVPNPGFPTVTNPQGVTESPEVIPDVRELTSEEAVRSGRYGGELRAQMLKQLKDRTQGGSQTLGSTPRHLVTSPVQSVPMPGGVVQPQGFHTGPVGNPNIQPAPGNAEAMRAQARAAVAGTHAGQNPVLGQNPGSQQALREAQATKQDPQSAFANRFTPTPPVTSN